MHVLNDIIILNIITNIMDTIVLGMQDKNNTTDSKADKFENSFDVYINSRKINPASIPLPSTFRTGTKTTSTSTDTTPSTCVTTENNTDTNDDAFLRYTTCDCVHMNAPNNDGLDESNNNAEEEPLSSNTTFINYDGVYIDPENVLPEPDINDVNYKYMSIREIVKTLSVLRSTISENICENEVFDISVHTCLKLHKQLTYTVQWLCRFYESE